MNKIKIGQKIVLFLLLFLIIGEILYYFYLSGGQLIVNDIFSMRWVNKPTLNQDNVLDYFRKEKNSLIFTDLLKYLKPDESEPCIFTSNCFEKRTDNLYVTYVNYENPFALSPLNKYYVIRLDLKNYSENLSSVALLGKLSSNIANLYWEDISALLFGTGDNNHYLYVEALPGDDEMNLPILDEATNQRTSWYIIFDREGKNFIISDKYFDVVRVIDINEKTGGKFPNGVFPDGKLYFGHLIAPQSHLMITNFSIAPL